MSRPVHQDYIVRQRYSNALPPPPGAPKLLDIKTGGLKQYTMPSYASRLARIQPLNIEADADLGMPIDLVGMPGVFEGDDTVILAPLSRPTPHPDDRNLLRPLKEIGQTKQQGGISFLRRTQYTAESAHTRNIAINSVPVGVTPKRRRLDSSKEDPRAILRNAIKGFDIANPKDVYTGPDTPDNIRGAQVTPAEMEAWKNPKHPKNPSLKPLDFYPLVPDFEAMPSDGGFMVTRFHGNPADIEGDRTQVSDENRSDPRIEAAFMHVKDPSREALEEYISRREHFEKNPELSKDPGGPPMRFEFFVPENLEVAFKTARAFDPDATPHAEQIEDLYTTRDEDDPSKSHFRIKHARHYETKMNSMHAFPWKSIAMALWDGDEGKDEDDDLGLGDGEDEARKRRLPKGAYFAPVNSSHAIRPERRIAERLGREDDDEDRIDVLHIRVDDVATEWKEGREALVSTFTKDEAE